MDRYVGASREVNPCYDLDCRRALVQLNVPGCLLDRALEVARVGLVHSQALLRLKVWEDLNDYVQRVLRVHLVHAGRDLLRVQRGELSARFWPQRVELALALRPSLHVALRLLEYARRARHA